MGLFITDHITNHDLILALDAVVDDDTSDTRLAFYDRLAHSMLLVTTASAPEHTDSGKWQLMSKGTRIKFMQLEDDQGRFLLPAFTDEEALKRWAPSGSAYAALPFDELCRMFLQQDGDAILINPAGPVGGIVTRPEIELLTCGMQSCVQAGT